MDPLDPLFLENINDPTACPVRAVPCVPNSEQKSLMRSEGSVARMSVRLVGFLMADNERMLQPQALCCRLSCLVCMASLQQCRIASTGMQTILVLVCLAVHSCRVQPTGSNLGHS